MYIAYKQEQNFSHVWLYKLKYLFISSKYIFKRWTKYIYISPIFLKEKIWSYLDVNRRKFSSGNFEDYQEAIKQDITVTSEVYIFTMDKKQNYYVAWIYTLKYLISGKYIL